MAMETATLSPEETVLTEMLKGPKPAIPVDWIWGVDKFQEDEKGAWYVEGHCTTYDLDYGRDEVTKEFAEEVVEQLIGLTLLHNHDPDQELGVIVDAAVDEVGIWVKALISKACPAEWTKIKEGILSKFSIRFLELKTVPVLHDDGKRKKQVQSGIVTEVSLTSLPMQRAARAHTAYVGKSQSGGTVVGAESMKTLMTGIKTFARAADKLVADYEGGKLKSVMPDIFKQEGEGEKEAKTHTVQEGETATSIAEKHGIAVSTLLEANELSSAEDIKVGMKLKIPEAGAGPEAAKPAEATKQEEAKPAEGPTNGDFKKLEALVVQLAELVKKLAVGVPKVVEAAVQEAITEEVKPVVEQIEKVEEKVEETVAKVEETVTEVKSIGAIRQGMEEDDEPGDGHEETLKGGSFWDGTTPVDRKMVQKVLAQLG